MQLLSIFHYVMAGFALLMIAGLFLHCQPFFMVTESGAMNLGQVKGPNGEIRTMQSAVNHQQVMETVTSILMVVYWVLGVLSFLACIGNFLSARWLTRRKNRFFSLLVAGFNCLNIPLGTALGVFTIIVLQRPAIARSYRSAERSAPQILPA